MWSLQPHSGRRARASGVPGRQGENTSRERLPDRGHGHVKLRRPLPSGKGTSRLDTENTSGSTSQLAAISEAIELGTSCLLVDEDTSATNFMIRNARMQQLVPDELEPIVPSIERA